MQSPPALQPFDGFSVCVFCGSSERADPALTAGAAELGRMIAARGWRLVYGGGGVGLMGAAARAAHEAGGRVVGIMPAFLRSRERLFDEVETVVVTSMHERKTLMYDASDAFIVAPGGVGTLEEAVEVLSWKRLDLHPKPVVFHSPAGFWDAFDALMRQNVASGMTPESFLRAYEIHADLDAVVTAVARASNAAPLQHDRR
ncbi:MAG: TIGR00730 family Rossman fold protein [Caulobacteraceae bacterium]|nr:TIGR00730 family Rossman fold protein [Caulobacteraceae bacterium]